MSDDRKNTEEPSGQQPDDDGQNVPLPPGPNYGPFGYFRLAILILAAVVVVLAILTFV